MFIAIIFTWTEEEFGDTLCIEPFFFFWFTAVGSSDLLQVSVLYLVSHSPFKRGQERDSTKNIEWSLIGFR